MDSGGSAANRCIGFGRNKPVTPPIGCLIPALLLAAAVAGCKAPPQPKVANVHPVSLRFEDHVSFEHLLAVGDELEIKFPFQREFNQQAIVRTDGLITLPLIGPIQAALRTPEQLQDEIQGRYHAIEYNPTIEDISPGGRQYLISVDDLLEVRFEGHKEYDNQLVVRPDGRISLPLVGSIIAEGKTPEQLDEELTARYQELLPNPNLVVTVLNPTHGRFYVAGRFVRPGPKDLDQCTVIVRTFAPRLIYITGEVGASGVVPFRAPMTALQAIVAAGGAKRSAKLDRVVILRRVGVDHPTALFVNLKPDLEGHRTNDVALRPFDIVVVPKTAITRINDVMDQYVYQLFPMTRNSSFVLFYDLSRAGSSAGMGIPVP